MALTRAELDLTYRPIVRTTNGHVTDPPREPVAEPAESVPERDNRPWVTWHADRPLDLSVTARPFGGSRRETPQPGAR